MGVRPSQARSPGAHPHFTRAIESKQLTVCKAMTKLRFSQLLWFNQVFFKLTTMATKLSVCLIYQRLFTKVNSRLFRATRIVTHGLTLLIIAYYVPAFFVSIFQCSPVSKSWRSKTSGTCIDLTKFRVYNAAANIITSVLIIATPLPALSTVRRSRPEVTELMVLILLGLVYVIVPLIQLRLGLLIHLSHTGCTIVRLVLMIYPDAATKTDPQCKFLPLCSIQSKY